MYCEKCGNKVKDNTKFCPKCGAAQSAESPPSKKSKSIIITAIACVAAVTVVLLLAFGIFVHPNDSMEELQEVSTTAPVADNVSGFIEDAPVTEETADAEDPPASESTPEIFHNYLKEVLIPETGLLIPLEDTMYVDGYDYPYIPMDGILSAYIDDLNDDGTEEMLVVTIYPAGQDIEEDYFKNNELRIDVYSLQNGEVTLSNTVYPTMRDDENYQNGFLGKTANIDDEFSILLKEMDRKTYICCGFRKGTDYNAPQR